MKVLYPALAAVVLVASGCGGKNILTDSQFGAQLTNETDNFVFQASSLDGVTQTIQWTWQNTGTNATVTHSSEINAGSATLTILDSMGQQLYMQPLAPSGMSGLGSGTPGDWIVRLTLTEAHGAIHFTVETAP